MEGIIPIAGMMQKKFGLPCKLTNDANAAAVGEMMYGCTKRNETLHHHNPWNRCRQRYVIDGKICRT